MVCSGTVDSTPGARKWEQVREILEAALAIPPADRPAFVRAAAAGDHSLVAELESLLTHADATATWIDGSPVSPPAKRHPEFQAGHRLAHYEIVKKLGAGGMGIVYLAKDLLLDRLAAVKLLASHIEAPEERRRFAREARAASALNHPNIITIYEFAAAAGMDFIAMEYVRGITLAERLKREPPPLLQLLEIARQTALALSRAHAAGIVHQDLKPANIMITDEGLVKVLDFGIARRISTPSAEASTERLSIAGTPAYMAPEVALGQPADQQADIFAFGVILYEMATRQRPFQGKDMPSVLSQVMYRNPPRVETINAEVPAGLGDLIESCLRKDKMQRVAAMEEIVASLDRITAPPARPSRRWLIAGGSAVAAVAATMAISRWVNGPASAPLSYTLEAQKEPTALPFTASPSDTFQAGWKFRLRLHAARPGFFYVLTETPAEVAVVYPLAAPPQPVAATVTGWFVFDQNPGLERVWLIWSEQSLPQLASPGTADSSRAAGIRQLLTRLPAGVPGMAGELLQLHHK